MTRRINGDALENRSGAAVTGNVFTFDDAHVDGGVWQAPSAGSASAAWPVGSIFFAAVSTNPATLLGFGTWSAIGAGRVLIGIDAGDADFDTLGETGGAKTTAHAHGAGSLATSSGSAHSHGAGTIATVAESSHTHAVGTLATVAESSHTHGVGTLAPSAHSGTAVDTHSNHTHGKGHWLLPTRPLALPTTRGTVTRSRAFCRIDTRSPAATLRTSIADSDPRVTSGSASTGYGGIPPPSTQRRRLPLR